MTDLTYAIADLHGSFDLLETALAAIETHSRSAESRTVVFLGDYVDRGLRSREVVARLLAGPSAGWKWVCLRGNHEVMMLETLADEFRFDWWMKKGGRETLKSYGHAADGRFDPSVVPIAVQSWIRSRPLFYVDSQRVYAHAGVDPSLPMLDQEENTLAWMRYPNKTVDVGWRDKHVVHGHTPYEDGPLLLRHRTNLDTLAWQTGRLVVGVFMDDRPGGPIDLIEVKRVVGEPSGAG